MRINDVASAYQPKAEEVWLDELVTNAHANTPKNNLLHAAFQQYSQQKPDVTNKKPLLTVPKPNIITTPTPTSSQLQVRPTAVGVPSLPTASTSSVSPG